MEFCGAFPKRTKIVIEYITIEQVSSLNFVECDLSHLAEVVWNKIELFYRLNGTIKRTLMYTVREEILLKMYYYTADGRTLRNTRIDGGVTHHGICSFKGLFAMLQLGRRITELKTGALK